METKQQLLEKQLVMLGRWKHSFRETITTATQLGAKTGPCKSCYMKLLLACCESN